MTAAYATAADPIADIIARASQEIWDRRIASLHRRVEAAGSRRRIAAIDAFIEVLEDRNLEGTRTVDRLLRRRLHNLVREVGLPLPRKALRARTTPRLHAAMLDWQEELLDTVLPQRLSFADVHDSDWSTPHPVGW